MTARLNIPIGTRYGHLVTQGNPEIRGRHSFVECRCDCGNVRVFKTNNLRTGNTVACGCMRGSHRKSATAEYGIWRSLKDRCVNPNSTPYRYYGGRGITVCQEWRDSFEVFYKDMGPRPTQKHSIERIDNNGPYAPWNCKWATMLEQGRNQRRNRFITFQNETLCVTDWARKLNIDLGTLCVRLARWPLERALTEPAHHRKG